VPFHVEITRSLHHARVFNLDEDQLRREVVEPWGRAERVELGGREWEPAESTLTILEGPRLAPADLAHGQGWHHARRSARAVTADVLRVAARVRLAMLAGSEEAKRLAAAVVGELDVVAIDWSAVRAAIVAGEPPGVDAALVIVDGEAALLDAGLAVGALGRRAAIVWLGVGAPASALAGLDVLVIDPDDPDAAPELRRGVQERLSGTRRPSR
jgi:hypothetical protein